MSGWRYIAQRYDGTTGGYGDFLDFNVPLEGVNIEDVLSGDNALSGTITPEYPRLKGADGQPILKEGGCAIWAEDPDGEIRGGGLLTHSGFNAEGDWAIECEDLTSTSNGLPYGDANSWVNVDPIDLYRHMWSHIQSHPHHNLGISIDPTTSPVRLGTDLIEFVEFDTEPDVSADLDPVPAPVAPPRYATNGQWRDAAVKALKAKAWSDKDVEAALRKWLNKDSLTASNDWKPLTDKERTIRDRAIQTIGWPPNPPSPGHSASTLVVNMRPQMNPPTGGEIVGDPEVTTEPKPIITYQHDAYKLNWYSTLDLGAEMANLAAETPFDWHMTHAWNGDAIKHHIRIGHPRLGRRRDELRFVVGENIHTSPDIERDGTEYANEVWVFGAGEGALQVVGRAFRRDDGRVRKVVTISDPSIISEAAAITRAQQELAKRFNIDDITSVELIDHPHARIGEVDLGDEILIEGDIGWIDFSIWCRVIGRTISPDDGDKQVLTVIRSDRVL